MSTTVLARTDHGPVQTLARLPRDITATSTRSPRPSRKDRREARRLRRYDDSVTNLNPRVIDLQIRSTAMWPRSYR
jgi:hypothetical protein